MEVLSYIAFGVVLWATGNLIYGLWLWWRRTKMTAMLQTEIAQRHFGVARNKLMEAAMKGEIRADSHVFKLFYSVNTALLRRPDQYQEISKAVTPLILMTEDETQQRSMKEEIQALSPTALEAIKATADALGHLVVDYSFVFRFLLRHTRSSNPQVGPFEFLYQMRKWMQESNKENVNEVNDKIRRAQKDVQQLIPAT